VRGGLHNGDGPLQTPYLFKIDIIHDLVHQQTLKAKSKITKK